MTTNAAVGEGHGAAVVPIRFDALSYLESNAALTPDKAAIWQSNGAISFARLRAQVWALMAELEQRSVGRGDVVAVALPNIAMFVALEIAIPAVGATILPLPMGIGQREFESALQRSGASVVITDSSPSGVAIAELAAGSSSVRGVSRVDELARATSASVREARPVVVPNDPDRIVQIALTSGTTGLPKLASLSARLKQLTFEGFTTRLRIVPGDRMLPMSPITQGVGEMCLYAMRRGAALVMLGETRFDPERVLEVARRSAATILGGVPTMIGRLLHSPGLGSAPLPALRATISAGAPLPPAVARAWEERTGSRICSFFGAMDIGQLAVPDPEDPAEKRFTTVGRPHDAAEVRICGPDGRELGPGETGEICMRGPLVQQRYWGEADGPFGADGWAHFGDLGFLDPDGFLHVTGRIKDTIIRGGNNINPLEVEELLREHPAVQDACVVGRPDPDLGERATAFVALAPSRNVTLNELTEFLARQGLTRYKWPERLELVETLPLGPTGKVNRTVLRERAAPSETDGSN